MVIRDFEAFQVSRACIQVSLNLSHFSRIPPLAEQSKGTTIGKEKAQTQLFRKQEETLAGPARAPQASIASDAPRLILPRRRVRSSVSSPPSARTPRPSLKPRYGRAPQDNPSPRTAPRRVPPNPDKAVRVRVVGGPKNALAARVREKTSLPPGVLTNPAEKGIQRPRVLRPKVTAIQARAVLARGVRLSEPFRHMKRVLVSWFPKTAPRTHSCLPARCAVSSTWTRSRPRFTRIQGNPIVLPPVLSKS